MVRLAPLGFFISCSMVMVTLLVGMRALAMTTQNYNQNIFISEVNVRGSDSQTGCVKESAKSEYKTNVNFCWKDEWIEIANPTNNSVNLEGWSLKFRKYALDLSGYNINPKKVLTIGYQHSSNDNFNSVVPNINIRTSKLLYFSSDSADNITAILINKDGDEVDSVISSHKDLEGDFEGQKGYSYSRCSASSDWQKSQQEFAKSNYGTPGKHIFCNLETRPYPVEKEIDPGVGAKTEPLPETKPVLEPQNNIEPKPVTEISKQLELLEQELRSAIPISEGMPDPTNQAVTPKPGINTANPPVNLGVSLPDNQPSLNHKTAPPVVTKQSLQNSANINTSPNLEKIHIISTANNSWLEVIKYLEEFQKTFQTEKYILQSNIVRQYPIINFESRSSWTNQAFNSTSKSQVSGLISQFSEVQVGLLNFLLLTDLLKHIITKNTRNYFLKNIKKYATRS